MRRRDHRREFRRRRRAPDRADRADRRRRHDGARRDAPRRRRDASPPDAASTGDAATACTTLTLGPSVTFTYGGAPPPLAKGGVLPAATLTLVSGTIYGPATVAPYASDVTARATIAFTAATVALREAVVSTIPLHAKTTDADGVADYTVAGTPLTTTATCPAPKTNTETFTVNGASVMLYVDGATVGAAGYTVEETFSP